MFLNLLTPQFLMMKLNMKELVKQHFNLVDANAKTEAFTRVKTIDGELEMEYDELAAGKEINLITEDGKVPAPTGEYELEGNRTIRVEDGIIADVKEVAKAELDEAEEDVSVPKRDVEVDYEELAAETTKDKFDARTDAEEEGYLDGIKDEKADEAEEDKVGLSDEQMKQLITELAGAVDAKLSDVLVKVAAMETRLEKLSIEPATQPTIVKSQSKKAETFRNTFSKTFEKTNAVAERRELLLQTIKNQ
jgi:hypothetical protein|tara:strand:- start:5426 stop:6172 length:747 start_codon:yes stop_codon:yes gene_type:complete